MSKPTRAQTIVLASASMDPGYHICGWDEDGRVIKALLRSRWIRPFTRTIRGTIYELTQAGIEAVP